jgi:hypothetical protein
MRIFIIRHAEKPDAELGIQGLNEQGEPDPASLSTRGWQRAGALVTAFCRPAATEHNLPQPLKIYAANAQADGKLSLRSIQTVTPLAEKLKLTIDSQFGKGNEAALAKETSEGMSPVLICWAHEGIPEIASSIMSTHGFGDIPQMWPSSRYDLIWSFSRTERGWQFAQLPQLLLAGDSREVLA